VHTLLFRFAVTLSMIEAIALFIDLDFLKPNYDLLRIFCQEM